MITTPRFSVLTHIPKGSADAQYHIVDGYNNDDVVAIIDPNQLYANPDEVAQEIANAMNICRVME